MVLPAPEIWRNEEGKVEMQGMISGPDIRYTLDGSTPTESSALYAEPVSVTPPCTVKAVAVGGGYGMSDVAVLEVAGMKGILPAPMLSSGQSSSSSGGLVLFDIELDNISVYPEGAEAWGRYGSVFFSGRKLADITDGVVAEIPSGADALIRIIAPGWEDSPDTEISVQAEKVATPSISYSRYTGVLSISCSTSGASIYWRKDGEDEWTLYSSSVTLTEDATVYAYAKKSGMDDSSVASKACEYIGLPEEGSRLPKPDVSVTYSGPDVIFTWNNWSAYDAYEAHPDASIAIEADYGDGFNDASQSFDMPAVNVDNPARFRARDDGGIYVNSEVLDITVTAPKLADPMIVLDSVTASEAIFRITNLYAYSNNTKFHWSIREARSSIFDSGIADKEDDFSGTTCTVTISNVPFHSDESTVVEMEVYATNAEYDDSSTVRSNTVTVYFLISTPVITQSGNTATFTCSTEGVTIHYSGCGISGTCLSGGTAEIEEAGTMTAYATKSGYEQSSTASLYFSYINPPPSVFAQSSEADQVLGDMLVPLSLGVCTVSGRYFSYTKTGTSITSVDTQKIIGANGIVGGNGIIIIYGNGILVSDNNGISFDSIRENTESTETMAFGNGVFARFCYTGLNNPMQFQISSNGRIWSNDNNPCSLPEHTSVHLIYDNGSFIFIRCDTGEVYSSISSSNFIWTKMTNLPSSLNNGYSFRVCLVNHILVCSFPNDNCIVYSDDYGDSWHIVNNIKSASTSNNFITYAEGNYIMTNTDISNSKILKYSTNLTIWKTLETNIDESLNSIAYYNGKIFTAYWKTFYFANA